MNKKITIRKGCFETNSSSEHSLIVDSSREYVSEWEIKEFIESYAVREALFRNDDGTFYLPKLSELGIENDFDSTFCIYEKWYERLSYLVSFYSSNCEAMALISKVVSEIIPNCKGFCFLTENVNTDWGWWSDIEPTEINGTKFFPIDSIFCSLGTIDHQSTNFVDQVFMGSMRKLEKYKDYSDEALIKEFITNNRFVILTDGDGGEIVERLEELIPSKLSKDTYIAHNVIRENGEYDWYNFVFKKVDSFLKEQRERYSRG